MHMLWLTDLHLDFLDSTERKRFYHSLERHPADCMVITGDIANALCLSKVLIEMHNAFQRPIYFILGNHDYYSSSVKKIRKDITMLCMQHEHLSWMGGQSAIALTPETILTGHDTWADGRYGNYDDSYVHLQDADYILELIEARHNGRQAVLQYMQHLADNDAHYLEQQIVTGLSAYQPKRVFILMHVPPFQETCLYQQQKSCVNYLPFFASKANGDLLERIAHKYPDIMFVALCGHIHHKAFYQPLSNLSVHVEEAEYLKTALGHSFFL